jgi:hypothetical protein
MSVLGTRLGLFGFPKGSSAQVVWQLVDGPARGVRSGFRHQDIKNLDFLWDRSKYRQDFED